MPDDFLRQSPLAHLGLDGKAQPLRADDAGISLAELPFRAMVSLRGRAEDPRFVGDDPVMHPAWTAGWAEGLMRHNVYIPSSMHTRSRFQQLAPIPSGQVVTGGAHFLEAYERRAHHFANYDVLLRGEDGTDLARLRHWTVFRIATPEERAAAGG